MSRWRCAPIRRPMREIFFGTQRFSQIRDGLVANRDTISAVKNAGAEMLKRIAESPCAVAAPSLQSTSRMLLGKQLGSPQFTPVRNLAMSKLNLCLGLSL